jgi:hypothetical protein
VVQWQGWSGLPAQNAGALLDAGSALPVNNPGAAVQGPAQAQALPAIGNQSLLVSADPEGARITLAEAGLSLAVPADLVGLVGQDREAEDGSATPPVALARGAMSVLVSPAALAPVLVGALAVGHRRQPRRWMRQGPAEQAWEVEDR